MEAYVADQHLEDTWADTNSIDEDGSYIEIELDASPTCYNSDDDEDKGNLKGSCCTQYNDDDDDEGGSKEYQLRISISSTISLSLEDDHKKNLRNGTVPTMTAVEAPCMSPLMSISADDATARSSTESQEIIMPRQHSSVVSKKIGEQGVEVEFSVQNRPCNTVLFNRRDIGLESAQLDGQTTSLRAARVIPNDKEDVLYACARKQPNFRGTTTTTTTRTTTTTNGGMMKLLIKFRGIKMGALLASLMKPRQPFHANNGQKSSKKSKTFFQSKMFFQCYQKSSINPTNGRRCNNMKRDQGSRSYKNWDLEDDNGICSGSLRSSSKKSSSKVMEMDLGALRGIFNAVGINIGHKGGESKKNCSQSTSCDTTPIHEGFSLFSSENSNVQAAITYCKSSLRQSSSTDFSF